MDAPCLERVPLPIHCRQHESTLAKGPSLANLEDSLSEVWAPLKAKFGENVDDDEEVRKDDISKSAFSSLLQP